jgi:hypothetical protein
MGRVVLVWEVASMIVVVVWVSTSTVRIASSVCVQASARAAVLNVGMVVWETS